MAEFLAGTKGFFIGLGIGVAGGAVAFYFLVAKVQKIKELVFGK